MDVFGANHFQLPGVNVDPREELRKEKVASMEELNHLKGSRADIDNPELG